MYSVLYVLALPHRNGEHGKQELVVVAAGHGHCGPSRSGGSEEARCRKAQEEEPPRCGKASPWLGRRLQGCEVALATPNVL